MAVTLSDMLLIHDAFRREFALVPGLVRAVGPGDVDRSGLVARHLSALTTGLHIHHDSEDELVWPRLRERGRHDVAALDDMDSEHEALAGGVHRIDELTGRWAGSADRGTAEALAREVEDVAAAIDAHLDHEEEDAFPLMDRYMTQQEWDDMGEHGWARTPPDQVMIFMGQMAAGPRQREWAEFLGRLPPPLVAAFHAEGLPAYDRYVLALHGEHASPLSS